MKNPESGIKLQQDYIIVPGFYRDNWNLKPLSEAQWDTVIAFCEMVAKMKC